MLRIQLPNLCANFGLLPIPLNGVRTQKLVNLLPVSRHKSPIPRVHVEGYVPDGHIRASSKLNQVENRLPIDHGKPPGTVGTPSDIATSCTANKVAPLQGCGL